MAKLTVDMDAGVIGALQELEGRSYEIIAKAVDAGAKEAEGVILDSLLATISPAHQNGELVNAFGRTPVDSNGAGFINSKIGFREPRKDQSGSMDTKGGKRRSYYVRTNAMIANVIEHGSQARNIPARPFLKPVQKKAEQLAEAEILRVFDEEVGDL